MITAALLVPSVASADESILLGMKIGGVIGHGPLIARLDPIDTVGMHLVVASGPWSVDGGFVLLRPAPSSSAAARRELDDTSLVALGAAVEVRRIIDRTPIGSPFVGLGFSTLRLQPDASPEPRIGGAMGPRLTLGMDLAGGVGNRRGRVLLGASYQWLVAGFADGGRASGGFASLELTFLGGAGTQRL